MELLFLIAAILAALNLLHAVVYKTIFFAGGWINYYENRSHFWAGFMAFLMFLFFYGGFYFFIFPAV
ncbi:hypothetical protein [Thaumasiovibrio subtropicus]|uniref:hypothetical protein n=1 Tax=Thaumasiovibrio subtropicus TaxID=1891207 RepID=UPI000B34CF09|nr:hypothetical protein [Thaumasiovibrio subtropicus]